MWEDCRRLGVAAITYTPLAKVNLSLHERGKPRDKWSKLESTQKASLGRVAYEMRGGDIVYVREGDKIVGAGVVKGRHGARAYRFDSGFRLRDPHGTPWAHQVPVSWSRDFVDVPNRLGRDQVTVLRLAPGRATSLERDIARARRQYARKARQDEKKLEARLREDKYFRESPANLRVIIPRHKKLSNRFCDWLKEELGVSAHQELQWVDVSFDLPGRALLAELKVCYRTGARKSIREALGQILEYNLRPPRVATDEWLVILDTVPATDDRRFITSLRKNYSLPLILGWRTSKGFAFHPRWPNH